MKAAMKSVEEIEGLQPGMPKELNRHVKIAINHLNKRRDALLERSRVIHKEIEEIDAALMALE